MSRHIEIVAPTKIIGKKLSEKINKIRNFRNREISQILSININTLNSQNLCEFEINWNPMLNLTRKKDTTRLERWIKKNLIKIEEIVLIEMRLNLFERRKK